MENAQRWPEKRKLLEPSICYCIYEVKDALRFVSLL